MKFPLGVGRAEGRTKSIAILIDGDNAQPSLIEEVLAEAAKYGTTTVRRIYGDFTNQQMSGWKHALNDYAFQPHQQFRFTTGKNATDSALIIDAMDLLHSDRVKGFCIVSSDSDFTRLATRIREEGLFVMGIGEPKTPKSFVNACEIFVHTTILVAERTVVASTSETDWSEIVSKATATAAREDGWAFLGAVGVLVRKLDPAFDPRSFGHKQLSTLVKSKPGVFETRESRDESGTTVIDVRVVG